MSTTASDPSRAWRRAPGLWRLLHYRRAYLPGDLLAGLTVAAYMIPQVMAYANIAGLPVTFGLWASLGPLLMYAILGSSRQLSAGPESTTSLMTAAAVLTLTGATAGLGVPPANAPGVAAALALAVGVICLAGWLLRLGFLAHLLSRPVLVGYLAGIAVLMIVSQLSKVTGVPVTGGSTITQLWSFVRGLPSINLATTAIAAVVLTLLLAQRRWLPKIPGPLIVIVAGAVLVALAGLERYGVRTVGAVPGGLPAPALPDLAGLHLGALLTAAAGVAVVAYSDTILTARAFAERGDEVDGEQELLALGATNVAASLTSGFPVSSSGSRTALADAMGARTQLYSLVAMAAIVLTLLVLAPAFATVPTAALGAVVVYAALRLIEIGEFRRLAAFRRSELLLALATTLAVLAFGVLYGIGIALLLSILDLLRRIAAPHDGVLGFIPGLAGMHDVEDYPVGRQIPGLVVYRYDSPLFFANAENFRRRALVAVDEAEQPVHWFVLNAEANVEVDLTAADALEELRASLDERGIIFAMARLKFEMHDELERAGIIEHVGRDRIFATLPTAVAAYEQWRAARDAPANDPS